MAMNPLSPTMAFNGQGGSPVPGVNVRPYPQMGPAQGGIGAGASESTPAETPPDNIEAIVRLMTALGIDPNDPASSSKAQGLFMGLGLPTAKRLASQSASRGITDQQTGVGAAGGPQGPPPPPPVPPSMG